MNQAPSGPDLPDDVDERYRRASALDPSRPGETVQRAVLAHAARLAAERATQDTGASGRVRPRRTQRWRRPAILGTFAAAALAAVLVAPRFLAPPVAPAVVATPVAQSARSDVPPAPAAAPPAPSAPAADNRTAGRNPPLPLAGFAGAAKSGDAARGAPAAAGAQGPDVEGAGSPANRRQASSGAASARANAAQLGEAYAGSAEPAQRAAAFQHAAERGDLATLQALLAKQVNIDARDSLGRTALMLATLHSQTDTVAALLAAGADPNLADLRGTTPLQAAMAADQTAIIAALQRYGAR